MEDWIWVSVGKGRIRASAEKVEIRASTKKVESRRVPDSCHSRVIRNQQNLYPKFLLLP